MWVILERKLRFNRNYNIPLWILDSSAAHGLLSFVLLSTYKLDWILNLSWLEMIKNWSFPERCQLIMVWGHSNKSYSTLHLIRVQVSYLLLPLLLWSLLVNWTVCMPSLRRRDHRGRGRCKSWVTGTTGSESSLLTKPRPGCPISLKIKGWTTKRGYV